MKTIDEILKQKYISASDLTILIPNLKLYKAREYINELQVEMEALGYFVPITAPKVALTKLARKKYGF